MVYVIYGTTGELIKLIPLLDGLKRKKIPHTTIGLVQQQEQLTKLFATYSNIEKPDFWIVHGFRGKDLAKFYQMPFWLIKAFFALIMVRPKIKKLSNKERKNNYIIVHGDTITTVVGALFGRSLGYRVAHIEAGLRSFNLLHPFPEELDRRIVSAVARVHFAPGDTPMRNLKDAGVKGETYSTEINTVYDSIQYALKVKPAVNIDRLPKHYGIISIHRNELLAQKVLFERTIRLLAKSAKKTPMVFLKHPITFEWIKSLGLEDLAKKSFIYAPKLDYFSFINLLNGADFVITDSGGLQEECTYLGIPCLIHRKATERMEGLESGITQLSYHDLDKLSVFLGSIPNRQQSLKTKTRPTEIILKYLSDNLN